MPSSTCWPRRLSAQSWARGDLLRLEHVGMLGAVEHAAPADPGAEAGRHRDVGRGRDDARRELALVARELAHDPAERLLGRGARARAGRSAGSPAPARRAAHAPRCARANGTLGAETPRAPSGSTSRPAKRSHSWPSAIRCALLERRHLLGRHQPGVVVLVAGERQAEALDRVGDEAVRPVVLDAVERLEHAVEVVAAEIGHQARERVVVVLLEQRRGCRRDGRGRAPDAGARRRRP